MIFVPGRPCSIQVSNKPGNNDKRRKQPTAALYSEGVLAGTETPGDWGRENLHLTQRCHQ